MRDLVHKMLLKAMQTVACRVAEVETAPSEEVIAEVQMRPVGGLS